MSDHEFNNYLTLLAGLLRLGDKQRRAIAEELRTHLEDRLEELLARGVSREEAVQRALAEFGDAAGLAAQFASISRGRRRRWLMRVTTFSVAATVLIAAGIVTFWPGRNAGPGQAEAVAQPPASGSPDANQPARRAKSAERPLEDALNKRIDVEFVETPLKDAIQYLKDQVGFQYVIRKKTLDDAGVSPDVAVTINLKQVRLNTVLELMLQDLGLVHTEKDDVLLITTPDDAEATLEIRVYDCRDLLAMPEPGGDAKRPLARSPGMPARSNPPPSPPPAPGDPLAPPTGLLRTPSGLQRIPAGVDPFAPPPAPGGGVPVPSPGTSPPPTPQPNAPGAARPPARDPFAPSASTPPAATPLPTTVLPQYAPPDVLGQGFGGGGGGFGDVQEPKPLTEHEQRAERLIELITTNVNPQSWTEVGGPGSISEYHGLIVVTQTAQTHKKVENVLNMLRQAADLNAPQGRVVR